MSDKAEGISFFEKYLSIWVVLCIVVGILIGKYLPSIPDFLSKLEYAHVSIPIAFLIWIMIYPMMLEIDFSSIFHNAKKPKGLTITLITNWIIKPFTMYGFAYLFFKIIFSNFISPELSTEYLAGAVLLGAAPCTAMVFVWSYLTDGNPEYTLMQVSINDIIILFLYTPIVAFLLGISNIEIPYNTLLLSVLLFVVIPLISGFLTRKHVVKKKGKKYFKNVFLKKFDNITVGGLLLTLIIIFTFQGDIILKNPIHILLIAVPLSIQTLFVFGIAYLVGYFWNVKHDVAAPGAMIGASNFFELAVAVAISLFGLQSGATLATVVGVLVEVPLMLSLVKVANKSKDWFKKRVLEN